MNKENITEFINWLNTRSTFVKIPMTTIEEYLIYKKYNDENKSS